MCRKLSNYVRFAARDVAQPVTRRYPHVTVKTKLRKKKASQYHDEQRYIHRAKQCNMPRQRKYSIHCSDVTSLTIRNRYCETGVDD